MRGVWPSFSRTKRSEQEDKGVLEGQSIKCVDDEVSEGVSKDTENYILMFKKTFWLVSHVSPTCWRSDSAVNCRSFPDPTTANPQHSKPDGCCVEIDCATCTMQITARNGLDNRTIVDNFIFLLVGEPRCATKEGQRGFDYLHGSTQPQERRSANWVRRAVTVAADTSWSKWGTEVLQAPLNS